MAKVPMRVISRDQIGEREVRKAHGPGSMVIKGSERKWTFLCGNCRAVLARNVGPDRSVLGEVTSDGEVKDLATMRDVVFECKQCGALNEVGQMRLPA